MEIITKYSNGDNIFFTSDTHFSHKNIIEFCERPFKTTEEMNQKLIENWNNKVGPNDIVYHLGDVMLGDNSYGIECVKRLKGTIYIIPGNHDTTSRMNLYKQLNNVHVLESGIPELEAAAAMLKYNKYNFYLSHHPTLTSNLEKAPYLKMHQSRR